MPACSGDKHDLRFVYCLPDITSREIVYDDNDVPIVTEWRARHFECRACFRPVPVKWDEPRTYTPAPVGVTYSYREGMRVVYPSYEELTRA